MTIERTSWANIDLEDLFFAFRKAKADCFFETSIRVAEKFVRYEESLGENFTSLLERLQAGEIGEILSEGLGEPAIFPKKVGLEPGARPKSAHAFFSDAKRAFQKEKKNSGDSALNSNKILT